MKIRNSSDSLTLDEWVSKYVPELEQDVSSHVGVYLQSDNEVDQLTRLIMISIRQCFEDKV